MFQRNTYHFLYVFLIQWTWFNPIPSWSTIFEGANDFACFIFCYRLKRKCVTGIIRYLIIWMLMPCRDGLSQCITNIDKEIIEFIGYVNPIINNNAIWFEFCTWHLIFPFIDHKFDNLPWIFDVWLMFSQKVMAVFPFGCFNQLIWFVPIFLTVAL